MSSWAAHQKRDPRSSEPGTDFYCPIGTPVYAPANGRVYGYGESIIPATGRWIGLDLENGMRFRAMHFSRIVLSKTILNNRGFVRKGQLIAYSGASGYGDEDWSWNPNTGGAHTHVTLWPTWASRYGYQPNGKPYTIDFMKYADTSSSAGSGESEEDDMTPEQSKQLNAVYDAIFRGGNSMKDNGASISDSLARIARDSFSSADNTKPIIYSGGRQVSIRQSLADTNGVVTQLQASQAGLEAALEALASAKGFDPSAIRKAAQEGVEAGLRNVTFSASVD